MAKAEHIHQLINRIGQDPALVDELISKKDQNDRKSALESRGIVTRGEKGPTREEVAKEITKLLTQSGGKPAGGASTERAVEWVGAIATAAAGAAAAACTAEV